MVVGTILNFIILVILFILNANYYLFYVINIILLIGLVLATFNKNISLFILFICAYFIESLYLPVKNEFYFLLLIYYLVGIILLICYFRYVFNLNNNKLQLAFKNIQIPNDKNVVIAKYLSGPFKSLSGNVLVRKLDNSLLIKLENEEANVEELNLDFQDIKKIDIIKKPYHKTIKVVEHTIYQDYLTGNLESHKGFKIIKSYEIKINTNNSEIILLCFNYPTILYELTK